MRGKARVSRRVDQAPTAYEGDSQDLSIQNQLGRYNSRRNLSETERIFRVYACYRIRATAILLPRSATGCQHGFLR